MGKKTILKPVPIDYKFEEREARKALRIALKERCKEGKSFKTDAHVSKAKSRFERIRFEKAQSLARQRTGNQLERIESKNICRPKVAKIGYMNPTPIIINTGVTPTAQKGALIGVIIGVGLVWWWFSSEEQTTPKGSGTTHAVINCNPGNIKLGKFRYPNEIDPTDKPFRKFASWQDGYCGMVIHLRRYAAGFVVKGSLNTIRKIISEWAPASDGNNTSEYISHLCQRTGFSADQILNFYDSTTCLKMCVAMAHREDGASPKDESIINEGIKRANKYKITK